MRNWIFLAAPLLASCAHHEWVNAGATDPGALARATGDCTTESYRVVPVPNIQAPAKPNFLEAPATYETQYQLQSSNGTQITGTSTTTAQGDMWAKQHAYQAAQAGYSQQMQRVAIARQQVFQGCMQGNGWTRQKVAK